MSTLQPLYLEKLIACLPAGRVAEGLGVGHVAVAVIGHHQLVLVGELAELFGLADRDLARDGARAEGFGQGEAVVHHLVGNGVDAVEFHDFDRPDLVLPPLAELRHLAVEAESRHLERSAIACLRAACCSGVAPRPALATTGAPIQPSTGWDRSSTPFRPSCCMYFTMSSALPDMPAEAVGGVDADLHSAELRVRLRCQEPGNRQSGRCQLAQITTRHHGRDCIR